MSMDKEREACREWAKGRYEPKYGKDWPIVLYSVNHGDKVQAAFSAGAAWQARAQAVQGEAVGVPLGAIENGRAFADRLEAYGFECEAGGFANCADWHEFRRCFDHLAEWASALAAPQPAPDVAGLVEALEGLLRHSGIADADPADKDEEDQALERAARKALSAHKEAL